MLHWHNASLPELLCHLQVAPIIDGINGAIEREKCTDSRTLQLLVIHFTSSGTGNSRQSGGWGLISIQCTHCCSQFSIGVLKRIQTPHSWIGDFGADKTSKTRLSGGRVQVWVQAPACHLATLPKAIPADNRTFLLQNQWPSSLGHAPAQLERVWRASASTGCFRVGCSRCGPQPARLRKTCYHSRDTDSVQESTRFKWFVNFGSLRVTFFFLKFSMELAKVAADQSSAHRFALS